MLYHLIVFYALMFVVVAWSFYCIEKCFRQQCKLIDDIYEANKASGYIRRYWHVIDNVSFEAHMWRLLTFRDPWAIYPPELAEVRKLAA